MGLRHFKRLSILRDHPYIRTVASLLTKKYGSKPVTTFFRCLKLSVTPDMEAMRKIFIACLKEELSKIWDTDPKAREFVEDLPKIQKSIVPIITQIMKERAEEEKTLKAYYEYKKAKEDEIAEKLKEVI